MKKEVKITPGQLNLLGIFIEDKGIKMDKAEWVYQTTIDIGNESIISWNTETLILEQQKTLVEILNGWITSNHKLVLESE